MRRRGRPSAQHVGESAVFTSTRRSHSTAECQIDHVQEKQSNPPMRVHNFAFPGATAEEDLPTQFSRFKSSFPDLALKGDNTVYCTTSTYDTAANCGTYEPAVLSLGINDCGRTFSDELEPIVEAIFDVLHDLYVKFGARNFVLIDVIPIDRSPGGKGNPEYPPKPQLTLRLAADSGSTGDFMERVETWNALLSSQAEEFAKDGEKATVFVFSFHRVLTEVLDEPLNFDFAEDDPEIGGAGIWLDDLHLTPAVHAIFAERLLDSLIKP